MREGRTFARAQSLQCGRDFCRALLVATGVGALLALGGCKSADFSNDVTGSIAAKTSGLSQDDEALRRYTEQLGRRYDSNPGDKSAAIAYAQALRMRGQYGQAVSVMQTLAIKYPQDLDIIGAYGKALADAGRLDEAADVLRRAHTPERPNWSILSAQGSVADRQGDHIGARQYYNAALKIAPGEPSVLSNLGLSYALTKDLAKAEQALRQAAANPRADARVRQNLALVLSLQGKYSEAEQLGERDLTPDQARSNVSMIRGMTAQNDSWRDLRNSDRPSARKVAMSPTQTTIAASAPSSPASRAADARAAAAADLPQ